MEQVLRDDVPEAAVAPEGGLFRSGLAVGVLPPREVGVVELATDRPPPGTAGHIQTVSPFGMNDYCVMVKRRL